MDDYIEQQLDGDQAAKKEESSEEGGEGDGPTPQLAMKATKLD
jgi:AFG3 family protein